MADVLKTQQPFPKGVLLSATALVAFALVSAFVAKQTDVGATRLIKVPATESLQIRLEQADHGATEVYNARDNRLITVLPAHRFGFVRVVMDGIGRDRMRDDIALNAPLTLERFADGRSAIVDPSTGRSVQLDAFGWSNRAAFTQLFALERNAQ